MLELLGYYRFANPPLRYSHFKDRTDEDKKEVLKSLYSHERLVSLFAFCLMPNHFHLLIKQRAENGISNFLRLVQNSYVKYLNTKSNRSGTLFQSGFKAVRIETEEQLIHVARYIHLNPLTSYVLRDFQQLNDYLWTSFMDYVSSYARPLVTTKPIKSLFSTNKEFVNFHLNQVEYQRTLERIKHLVLE